MTGDASASRPIAALPRRVAAWERIVAQVETGYRLDLDDWLNDMDLRRGIAETVDSLSLSERKVNRELIVRLAACDRRFRRATMAAGKCLWGATVGAREGWRPGRDWWYFRRPRSSNGPLDRAIDHLR